jgi:AcrR family transcriptional regulator
MIMASAPTLQSPWQRPPRADARRNYARLVQAADAVFTERGADASLDEIARRAGVGIGTLYRHFPTRRDLLEAVLADSIEALCAEAERLMAVTSPGDALATWLRDVVVHAATYRGLAAEILCDSGDVDSPTCASCESMRAAGARLLTRAQAAGAVRADIDAADLFLLVNGIAWATEQAGAGSKQRERLLDMMLDGVKLMGDG